MQRDTLRRHGDAGKEAQSWTNGPSECSTPVWGTDRRAEMRRLMPSENIIYFGDTSRVPYGGRSPEILLKYARQDVHFLRSFDIKAVLVACGTVSTTALPQLQAENDLPILGVVEPACRKAAAMTRNRRVGLIATAASVRSGAYERTLHRLDETIHVVSRACPLLVPLVENGTAISPATWSSRRWPVSIWSLCGRRSWTC